MFAALFGYFRTALRRPSVQKKVLETLCVFFAEAAVLVAVFPVLDTILANHGASQTGAGAQQGAVRNIWTVAIWSEGIAFLCLLAAVIIGITIATKGDN
jgi:hypothetical protein